MADDTVRTSVNLGIGVMFSVTAIVLAAFVRFIVSIVRRSRADLKVRDYTGVEAGLQARFEN